MISTAATRLVEQHPLTPFLPENGKILMLGSFPPQQKRWCMNFYYPNFTNDMWRLWGFLFYNDRNHFVDIDNKTFKEPELKAFLKQVGVGLYDTATAVIRLKDNASDKHLEVAQPTDINALLAAMPQCRAIVTTGEKATETICNYYHITPPEMGQNVSFRASIKKDDTRKMRLYRMPSSSRAYPLKLEKKAEYYKEMLQNEGLLK